VFGVEQREQEQRPAECRHRDRCPRVGQRQRRRDADRRRRRFDRGVAPRNRRSTAATPPALDREAEQRHEFVRLQHRAAPRTHRPHRAERATGGQAQRDERDEAARRRTDGTEDRRQNRKGKIEHRVFVAYLGATVTCQPPSANTDVRPQRSLRAWPVHFRTG